jgi:hypothetical protein
VAPPDNLNNQPKEKSATSTSKINNKTDFQSKKQRLLDLCKEKLSRPKHAKVTTFLPNCQRFRIPFIIKQVAKDENCLFWSILAAQDLDDSSHLELQSRLCRNNCAWLSLTALLTVTRKRWLWGMYVQDVCSFK